MTISLVVLIVCTIGLFAAVILQKLRFNKKYGGYYRVRLDHMADEFVNGMAMTSPVHVNNNNIAKNPNRNKFEQQTKMYNIDLSENSDDDVQDFRPI